MISDFDRSTYDRHPETGFEKATELFEDGQLLAAFDIFVELSTRRAKWFYLSRELLVDIVRRLQVAYARSPREGGALAALAALLSDADQLQYAEIRDSLTRLASQIVDDEPAQSDLGHAEHESEVSSRETNSVGQFALRTVRWLKGLGRPADRGSADDVPLPEPDEVDDETMVAMERDAESHRSQKTISRTPHIDIRAEGPVRPKTTFRVSVHLDRYSRRSSETGQDVTAPADSIVEIELFPSSHFVCKGDPNASFVIRDVDRQEIPPFEMECVARSLWDDDVPSVSAVFYVDGRPCGNVTRIVDIEGGRVPKTRNPKRATVRIGPNGLLPADLTVTIVADGDNSGRHFWCTVSTPHLQAYRQRARERWNLPRNTRELVAGFMETFTSEGTGDAQLIAELSGAGIQLFEAAPEVFRSAIWDLMDARVTLQSIAIVSAEPFIPWELMIPNRRKNGVLEERARPLGVEFDVGRWTADDIIAPSREIEFVDSYVIAPTYDDAGSDLLPLENASAEAEMVKAHCPGDVIVPADFATIEEILGGPGRSLVHFICHGTDGHVGVQSIHLAAGSRLTSSSVLRMKGVAAMFASKRPFVFLNACEVGRTAPTLVGVGGFATSFIKLGAMAVVAPLWSVSDAEAHEVAQEFYAGAAGDDRIPLSRVVSSIRAKAYNAAFGKDTYAAYCFYGDPCAVLKKRHHK